MTVTIMDAMTDPALFGDQFGGDSFANWRALLAGFYGLPLNERTVTLERAEVVVPDRIGEVVPFHAGETLGWRLV